MDMEVGYGSRIWKRIWSVWDMARRDMEVKTEISAFHISFLGVVSPSWRCVFGLIGF